MITAFKDETITPIENNPTFEDDNILVNSLLARTVKLVDEISPYLVKEGAESQITGNVLKNLNQFRKQLRHLDYQTLEQLVNSKVFTKSEFYNDVMLSANLVQFLHLREKLMETIYERSILHKIYKKQRQELIG